MKADWCKFYLGKYIKNLPHITPTDKGNEPYRIWQYWAQGLGNAPELVKTCLNSVDKFRGDIERVIITDSNVRDYVNIPEYIYDLKEKGIIKAAHFSDILRTYLLIEHGGCWIDATVLMLAPLPEYVKNAEIFFLQNNPEDDLDGLNMASYFISAKPQNRILLEVCEVINRYWHDNFFLVNYFAFLHMVTLVSLRNQANRTMWDFMPYKNFIPVQKMQDELLEPFNAERFEQFKQMSFIHKLTHKRKTLSKNKKIDFSGTLYEKLIERTK